MASLELPKTGVFHSGGHEIFNLRLQTPESMLLLVSYQDPPGLKYFHLFKLFLYFSKAYMGGQGKEKQRKGSLLESEHRPEITSTQLSLSYDL